MKTHTDCMTSRRIVKLPGFIDVHAHLRVPGAEHKEDFASGTAAALAGGITLVCAMPNTDPAIVDADSFNSALELAHNDARCDYALFVGAAQDNYSSVHELAPLAAALKMYLNHTYGSLHLPNMTVWHKHMGAWPRKAPLCVHAESQTTAAVLFLAHVLDRPVHICHVARKEEILTIRQAKERGVKVTCEVCPHHLFLSTDDMERIGYKESEVRPVLCSPEDQEALWENMNIIDVFATDHAPHTLEEKQSEKAPPGFPGLETILPLLLNAVHEGRLTLEDIINKFHKNPKRIFNLPEQPDTYVEVDLDDEWTIPSGMTYSKAGWTPFAGMQVRGSVHRVVLRGEIAYVEGQVLLPPGFGQNVREWRQKKITPLESTKVVSPEAPPETIRAGDWESEYRTNEMFSKLLNAEINTKLNVHFASENAVMRNVSPVPFMPRQRCDSGTFMRETATSHNLFGKHILTVDMFNKDQLNDIFNLAENIKARVVKDRPVDEILRGKVMASIFYEVSTRTSCSFAAAMQRLGGRVIHIDETSSSAKKGETLEDSVAVMAGYADVIVLRHPEPGAVAVSIIISFSKYITLMNEYNNVC